MSCKRTLASLALATAVAFCIRASAVQAAVISVDADAYPHGTDISTAFSGVTLRVIDNFVVSDAIYSYELTSGEYGSTTGTNVFAMMQSWPSVRLQPAFGDIENHGPHFIADFSEPVDFVSIDYRIRLNGGWAELRLRAYDGNGSKVAEVLTNRFEGPGESRTIAVSAPEIVTVQAAVYNGHPGGTWDNLKYSPVNDSVALAVRSIREHAFSYYLAIDMGVTGDIEPRMGSVRQLEIDVDDVTFCAGSVTVDCSPTTWIGTATGTAVGNTVTVDFSVPLPDLTQCTITLACGASVCVGNLEGDSNRDGVVNPVDNNQRLLRFGLTDAAAGAEWDMNLDGDVNPVDNNMTLLRFGNSTPTCP